MELLNHLQKNRNTAAVDLIDNGTDLTFVDQDGQTAVHRALLNGNTETFVSLVAYGANINILDAKGQSGLDMAMKRKDLNLVKLLCYFGAEVALQDWVLLSGDINSLNKQDQIILKQILDQNDRLAAINHGSIGYELHQLKPKDNIQYFSGLFVDMNTENITSSFFMYCAKESPEFTSSQIQKENDEHFFSDVFEVIAWGSKPDFIDLDIRVEGRPHCNEKLRLLSITGVFLKDIEIQKNQNHNDEETVISVQVSLLSDAKFTIVSKVVPEIFNVTNESLCIHPQMEKEAEIAIPEGTFDSAGQLQVNISETKAWNHEEDEVVDPVLFTNAIDLTMLNHSQPQKPVKLTLPVHSSDQNNDDIIILMSDKEEPEENEWEIRSNVDIHGKFISFDVNHLSVYIACSKQHLSKSITQATNAIKREVQVECFAMIKKASDGKLSLIIEYALKNKGKSRRKKWKDKGFSTMSVEYKDCVMKEAQTCKITLTGNIQTDSLRHQDPFLTLNPKKFRTGNYRSFHLINDTSESPLEGEVQIERRHEIIKQLQQQQHASSGTNKETRMFTNCCHKSVKHFEPEMPLAYDTDFELVVSLPIDSNILDIKQDEVGVAADDHQCTIPVLRKTSLNRITASLSIEECNQLGTHLHVSKNKIEQLETNGKLKEILLIWRPARPYEKLVHNLSEGLKEIDKDDMANNVEEAFENNIEYPA
ncbi:ANK [Mytilus coruscus]|uniref:ANK n=1 Tax=Mytilus coruscus TaxID=42192 RepID=A0A6J8A4L9_MYTCO|nr:ANK [Mytilus coruscus]